MKPYLFRIGLVVLFLAYFRVLLPDVAPHMTSGDAAELSLAGTTLGVAHSPGYPLHSLTYKLFGSLLHWGNPAYRQNVVSSLFVCTLLLLLGLLFVFVTGVRWSLLLSGLFFVSDRFKSLAYVTEVFPLTLVWGVLVLMVLYRYRASPRRLYILAYLMGLSLCIHQTLILIWPALLLFLNFESIKKNQVTGRSFLTFLGFFLLGLSPILFLPIRSWTQPVLDWEDPQTWSRFWGVITRARYGFFNLSRGSGTYLDWFHFSRVMEYSKTVLISYTGLVGALMLILGSIQSLGTKKYRRIFILSCLWILLSGPFFYWYAHAGDQSGSDIFERFTFLPYLMVIFLMGLGCIHLWKSKIPLYRGFMVFLMLAFIIENHFFKSRDEIKSYRWDASLREAVINILRMAPPRSILFSDRADETEFGLAYLISGENRRPQMEFVDCNAGVTRSIYGNDYYRIWGEPRLKIREEVEKKKILNSKIPVYYATLEPTMIDIFRIPRGLLFKAGPYQEIKGNEFSKWDKFTTWRFQPREKRGQSYFSSNMNLLGQFYFDTGQEGPALKSFGLAQRYGGAHRYELLGYWAQVRGEYGRSQNYYKKAFELGALSEALFSNWGALLLDMGRGSEALPIYEKGLTYFPSSTTILYNFAVARWQLGQREMVSPLIEQILKIQPQHEGALNMKLKWR